MRIPLAGGGKAVRVVMSEDDSGGLGCRPLTVSLAALGAFGRVIACLTLESRVMLQIIGIIARVCVSRKS